MTQTSSTLVTSMTTTTPAPPPPAGTPPSASPTEKLSTASLTRPLCVECGRGSKCKTPFQKPSIPKGWTHQILGVGTQNEDLGAVRLLLKNAGYRDVDFATVSSVRCPTKYDPSMRQLRACRPFLLRAIEVLKPRCVVAFGGSAARACLDRGTASVTKLRGRALQVGDVPLRVTYHPDAIARGATHLRSRVIDDLRRIRAGDRRDLQIVSEPLTDKVLSVDTEYDPNGNLLTLALSGSTKARAWDIAYHPGATQ